MYVLPTQLAMGVPNVRSLRLWEERQAGVPVEMIDTDPIACRLWTLQHWQVAAGGGNANCGRHSDSASYVWNIII